MNSSPSRSSTSATASSGSVGVSDEQRIAQVKFALICVGAVTVVKFITSFLFSYVFLLPCLYVYMFSTCPAMESFEGKKELKRVLRGNHLPESHPAKPKGYFEKMAAKVTASVTTELATLPGYEHEFIPMGGAAIISCMRVPTAKIECFWIGAFGKWHYVYSRELDAYKLD